MHPPPRRALERDVSPGSVHVAAGTEAIDDPKTNLIDWDGRPMDLHRSLSALVNRQLGCTH